MKKLVVLCVVLGLMSLLPATASAEPGNANGGWWFETEAVCDDVEVTIVAHGGAWSAIYAEDGRHFILVSQQIYDDRDGSLLFDVRQQGHPNQGPFVTCEFEVPEDFFGFPASAVVEGFWRP